MCNKRRMGCRYGRGVASLPHQPNRAVRQLKGWVGQRRGLVGGLGVQDLRCCAFRCCCLGVGAACCLHYRCSKRGYQEGLRGYREPPLRLHCFSLLGGSKHHLPHAPAGRRLMWQRQGAACPRWLRAIRGDAVLCDAGCARRGVICCACACGQGRGQGAGCETRSGCMSVMRAA